MPDRRHMSCVAGAAHDFRKRCKGRVIAAEIIGLPWLFVSICVHLRLKFLLRCSVEFFWRFARMAETHVKARGAIRLLSVKTLHGPGVALRPERSTVCHRAVRGSVIATREAMGGYQSVGRRALRAGDCRVATPLAMTAGGNDRGQ